ncbi:hypothetical protein M9H77_27041 [Catharanthus roseus]|uniref:Uncharacterized protein n=1 Tax=Catharanthus roseus TaxID=4058 RepID=A0ACC0AE37_CATRO|nr:hypothetical protein M9H77_27041 [Catharanthus roseus]
MPSASHPVLRHRCGLPREIAIELFHTFVIHGLIRQHLASNIGVSKSKIIEKEPIVWEILQEVMEGHPTHASRSSYGKRPYKSKISYLRARRPCLLDRIGLEEVRNPNPAILIRVQYRRGTKKGQH